MCIILSVQGGWKWVKVVLFGTFQHSLDAKNRLTLPSKIRNEFGSSVMLNFGVDGCIEIRTQENYDAYIGQIFEVRKSSKDLRKLERILSGSTFEVNIDASNRILLPDFLMKQTNISKDVVLVGVRQKLEIWDATTYYQSLDADYASAADTLDGLDNNEIK